ncbi:MAG TPA: hypothetical protein VEI02_15545, partial [Planctomycetota bacterium]|nr:hypothetical protein [Planctomycetota bacterium]
MALFAAGFLAAFLARSELPAVGVWAAVATLVAVAAAEGRAVRAAVVEAGARDRWALLFGVATGCLVAPAVPPE